MAKEKQSKPSASDQSSQEKIRTTVFITTELMDKVEYINYKEKTTRTDVVNEALADYVAKWEKKNGTVPKR